MTQPRTKNPAQTEEEELKQEIDDSLDEALEETFPASDPITPAVPQLDERKPGAAA